MFPPTLLPGQPPSFTLSQQDTLSDDITEIISSKPHWFIRRGIVVMGMVVGTMLVLSWIIHYPDIITAPMHIVAVNEPKLVVAKKEGKLVNLLVKNQERVTQNQPLVFLQSTADHQQVWQLQHWLTQAEKAVIKGNVDSLLSYMLPTPDELGEMQPVWQEFQSAFYETKQTLRNGYYQQKIAYLQKEMELMSEQEKSLLKQKELLEQDYNLQQQEYTAKEKLARDKVIAPLEFNQDKSKLLAKTGTLEQMQSQLVAYKVSKHNKQKELVEVQKKINDQSYTFFTALSTCKSKVDEWVDQYIILAPETGKIQFIHLLQANQYIKNGQPLLYVTPDATSYFVEVSAGQNGLGKIAIGQTVLIKLASYPQTEFGYLKGKILTISTIPVKDSTFLLHVSLPQGLKTNYNKTLIFTDNLQGKAEIITNDKRLLENLLNQLMVLAER